MRAALRPARPLLVPSCPLSSLAVGKKVTADASSVVEHLLRRGADGGGQQLDGELRALLTSAPYTSSHLLQVICSLPDVDSAIHFFEWCRAQDGSSLPAASALHVPSAYQAIFELAARQPGPPPPCARLKDLLDRSLEQGYALTLDSAALLVREFGSAGMVADVLHVVRSLKPSLRRAGICNGTLRLLFGASDPRFRGETVAVVREMLRSSYPKCRPDSATRSIVYSSFLRRNVIVEDDVVSILVEMAEHGVFPLDDMQFSQLVNKLCRSGKSDGAWKFLHAVKMAGGAAEAAPCNSLLSGLAKAGDFDRMNLLFEEMKEMGVHCNGITFGILINNLCKSRRVDDALQMLDDMTGGSLKHVIPDVVIFNTVVDGLCKVGRLEDGFAMLYRMKKFGCSPNTITYNSLIDGFCKAGEIDRAHELLAQMNDEDVAPNVVTMNTLIDGMCRHGRVSSAVEFFYKLQHDTDLDVKGNTVTYSTLIGAFLRANNMNKARKLFEEMLNSGLRADAITYFTMISALSQAGKLEEAYSIAMKMEKDGFCLDTRSYNILIAGFCKKKWLDRARDLLSEMIRRGLKPDNVTFNTLIAALCKVKDLTSAQLLISKMVEKGFEPSIITYGSLIHGYCIVNDTDGAMNTFRSMDAANIQPNTVVYNILIGYLTEKQEPALALSLMDEMQERGLLPSTVTYNALFRCLKEHHMLSEAFKLMDSMKEHNLKPDYVTIEILGEWLPAVGEVVKLKTFIEELSSLTQL